MRVFIALLTLVAATSAFAPAIKTKKPATKLDVSRRDVFAGIAGLVAAAPVVANAAGSTFFVDDKIELLRPEPSQMATGGKIDLNNAFVDEYMKLPGFFPHAAGKIASAGPYDSVKDIYKIEGLTSNDKQLFKKYEKEFTVNPPSYRTFNERINSRVST